MEFFATCSRGAEQALGTELRAAGVNGVRPLGAGVAFHGDVRDAYLALLWSRTAGRVLLTLGRVPAKDSDTLYEGVKNLPWEDHIASGRTIAVDARGVNDKLKNTQFTALRVKDAICDRLLERRGERPDVDLSNPDVLVNVVLSRDKATVSIDLAGEALDRRGYRVPGKPPVPVLRSNLAASLLLMAGWDAQTSQENALLNPLCGSGVIAVEAALIARDVAPGILRERWGFEGWAGHDEAVWAELLDAADERAQLRADSAANVCAWDTNAAAVEYAGALAKRAGVADALRIETVEAPFALPSHAADGFAGTVLACQVDAADLSLAQMPVLYSSLMATAAQQRANTIALLTADANVDSALGLEPRATAVVNNRGTEEHIRVYALDGAVAQRAEVSVRGQQVAVNDQAAQQFASRLNKVVKIKRSWAKEHKMSAYRVYDADLPDYNMAIDIYDGAGPDLGKRLVYVAEYAAPKQIDPAKTARRMADALAIIPVVLDVDPGCVFVKQRTRSKGGSQYADQSAAQGPSKRLITAENGLFFEVNLSDYLDTGLFLDHRTTRGLLSQLAKGKTFLNLFAYTGTASVYAAAGGAKYTTTVDLSNTYLEWAKRNFELNGLLDDHQEFERADVLAWVNEKRHTRERWDVIFCDPPTYSNSAKMGKRTWDVQRDHAELLIRASRLLTRGGAIVFSCNLRSFKPDVQALAKAGVQIADITARTIPEDFERNQKIHHCYVLRRVG